MNAAGAVSRDESGAGGASTGVDDRDTLHTLSLSIMPLKQNALKRARMIKNARLDSVIELFRDREIGSGQIEIEKLPIQFGLNGMPPEDFKL